MKSPSPAQTSVLGTLVTQAHSGKIVAHPGLRDPFWDNPYGSTLGSLARSIHSGFVG